MSSEHNVQRQIEIINKLGLHARAASRLVDTASHFGAQIELTNPQGQVANAKSIMSVLMLAASKGTTLSVSAQGDDAAAAMEAVCALIDNCFDEAE